MTSEGQAAAIAALGDQEHVSACRKENGRLRKRLSEAVDALGNSGLRAVPSAANFVLVTFPEDGALTAEAANEYLTDRGILTRWLPKQELPHALRITVGTEAETDAVIAALQTFVGDAGSPAD